MTYPRRLKDAPLRAPAWLSLLYGALMFGFAYMATRGGFDGVFAVVMACLFSFQFWTFATWRGAVTHDDRGTDLEM